MLTDEEQAAVRESIRRVRDAASAALRRAHVAAQATEFTVHLHRSVDAVALRAQEQGPASDCKAGCAHCCSVRVEATEPEVFRIARALKALPPTRLDAIMDTLRARLTETAAAPAAQRRDCPFLVDRLCSIYEFRPAACRKAHSLSVRRCESFAAELPQNLRLVVEAEALMAGTADAYVALGLRCSPQELIAAVLAALTDETAEARWFAGRFAA